MEGRWPTACAWQECWLLASSGKKSSCETGEIFESTPELGRADTRNWLNLPSALGYPFPSKDFIVSVASWLFFSKIAISAYKALGRSILSKSGLWADKFLWSLLFFKGIDFVRSKCSRYLLYADYLSHGFIQKNILHWYTGLLLSQTHIC